MSWQPRPSRGVGHPVHPGGQPEPASACEGSAGIGRPPAAASPPPHVVLGEGLAYVSAQNARISAQIEKLQQELAEVLRALSRHVA